MIFGQVIECLEPWFLLLYRRDNSFYTYLTEESLWHPVSYQLILIYTSLPLEICGLLYQFHFHTFISPVC